MSSSMRSNVLLAVAATLTVLVELEAVLRLLDAVTAADIFAQVTLLELVQRNALESVFRRPTIERQRHGQFHAVLGSNSA